MINDNEHIILWSRFWRTTVMVRKVWHGGWDGADEGVEISD